MVVFADFAQSSGPGASPLTVRIPASAPLRREWFLVCAAPEYTAFVSAWEFPGQQDTPDAQRRFEMLWSVDPPAVRDAAEICAQLACMLSPGLAPVLAELPSAPPAPASADLQRAIGLFNRMAAYLDQRTGR